MNSVRFYRRLKDGSRGLIGTARHSEGSGWTFQPNLSSHKPSRRFWPTLEACLPRWVGAAEREEVVR